MRPIEGLLTAMVTPFRADGRVNEEGAVSLGRHLLANGSDGLVVCGTTGESPTLSDDELVALVGLLSAELGDGAATVLLHPLAATIATLSLVGLLVSARSLQLGRAVPVIAVTSAAANVWTIASGPVVFGEPLPDDPVALSLRLLAFVLVIAACALTPAPVRAARMEPAQATTT